MEASQMQRGQQWLEQLLHFARLDAPVTLECAPPAESEPVASTQNRWEESCWLKINDTALTTDQVQALIGADGAVLDALQYLANTILNLGQPKEQQNAYTVELAGYRARRQAELQAMAGQAAHQVRETGEDFEMVALSAAERRQVHTFLKSFGDLETFSQGTEPDRRLVVRLHGQDSKSQGSQDQDSQDQDS
jgi:spoIIIJ-associated protein